MKQIEADSQGKVKIGTGTLFGSLKRMLNAGLVEESDKRVDPEMDDDLNKAPASSVDHAYSRLSSKFLRISGQGLAISICFPLGHFR